MRDNIIKSFADKIALVTGGSEGIGLGICESLGVTGARVGILSRNSEKGEKACEYLRSLAIDCEFFSCDVANDEALKSAVSLASEHFGGIDILVNNAAYVRPEMYQPFSEMDFVYWDSAQAVNFRGAVRAAHEALPYLKERKGTIINISSVGGKEAFQNATAYCPAKAALEHFTRCLARELGPFGVRVNAVAPGWIDTPGVAFQTSDQSAKDEAIKNKIPLGRIGKPEDVGAVVAFLASPAASYVTGSVYTVDGGWLLT